MKIIIHEGKDDKKYIKNVCKHLKLDVNNNNFYEMNGKSNFFNENYKVYKIIKANIKKISKILFVLDADYEKNDSKYGGYKNTKNEIIKIIKKLGLADISDYYIACDPNTKEGYFETLFFSCVSDKLKKCYDEFMHCSEFKEKENYKNNMTKLHELSSPEKPYDFTHDNFKELKEKLIDLFK